MSFVPVILVAVVEMAVTLAVVVETEAGVAAAVAAGVVAVEEGVAVAASMTINLPRFFAMRRF